MMNILKAKLSKALLSTTLLVGFLISFTLTYAQKPGLGSHCPAAEDLTREEIPGGCVYQYGSTWKSNAFPIKNCKTPKDLMFVRATVTPIDSAPSHGASTVKAKDLSCHYALKSDPRNSIVNLKPTQTNTIYLVIPGAWVIQPNLLTCPDTQVANCPFSRQQ